MGARVSRRPVQNGISAGLMLHKFKDRQPFISADFAIGSSLGVTCLARSRGLCGRSPARTFLCEYLGDVPIRPPLDPKLLYEFRLRLKAGGGCLSSSSCICSRLASTVGERQRAIQVLWARRSGSLKHQMRWTFAFSAGFRSRPACG
jgi:hypothetical protein